MTTLEYLTDSYKRESSAKVLVAEKTNTGWNIVLDATILYPQGGGQPSDTGRIIGMSWRAHVKHVRLSKNGTAIHEASVEGMPKIGETVTVMVDWDRRFHNMRIHTAGHILHEAVRALYPEAVPVKADHGSSPYIQYKGTIPETAILALDAKANAMVEAKLPITSEFVSYDDLVKRVPTVPEHLPTNKPLRIVTVQGCLPVPDGGTQLTNTSESGYISVTGISSKDGVTTVSYGVANRERQEVSGCTGDLAAFYRKLDEAKTIAMAEIAKSTENSAMLAGKITSPTGAFGSTAKLLSALPKESRRDAGIRLNEVKSALLSAIKDRKIVANRTENTLDVTLPGRIPPTGRLHPTTVVTREMNAIFAHMGFSVAEGPEIETDEYNYDRLNLPADHPARDLQDTLFIAEPDLLLRTQTSSIEAHILETHQPPYRFVMPGKVYRNENANASNNIMFYQYQGLAVDRGITMSDLRGTLDAFVKAFFGPERETRFRCKYYPEVEPGVGVDITCGFCHGRGCTVCKGRGWVEMLGAGMVHPNMLKRVNIDPAVYSGFAWGMGLDRIVMQRYGISDIRSLYNGDIGYLE